MKAPKKPSPASPATERPAWMFPPITRPSYTDQISFPENLPALAMRDLGLFHGRYTGLLAYAAAEQSKLQVEKLRLESVLSMETSRRTAALSVQDIPKWKIANAVGSSANVAVMRDQLLKLECQLTLLNTYRENFERYASALSREMSRRASEMRV